MPWYPPMQSCAVKLAKRTPDIHPSSAPSGRAQPEALHHRTLLPGSDPAKGVRSIVKPICYGKSVPQPILESGETALSPSIRIESYRPFGATVTRLAYPSGKSGQVCEDAEAALNRSRQIRQRIVNSATLPRRVLGFSSVEHLSWDLEHQAIFMIGDIKRDAEDAPKEFFASYEG
jgi:hypothetical protein